MKKSNLIKFATCGLLTAFALGCEGCGDSNPTGGNGGGNGGDPGNQTTKRIIKVEESHPGLTSCVREAQLDAVINTPQNDDRRRNYLINGFQSCVNQFGGSITVNFDDGSQQIIR